MSRENVEYVVRSRGQGKTTRLIEWLSQWPEKTTSDGFPARVLLTLNNNRAQMLQREHRALANRILPISAIGRRPYGHRGIEFVLDDGEEILLQAFPHLDRLDPGDRGQRPRVGPAGDA